jgi:hypothetical protein
MRFAWGACDFGSSVWVRLILSSIVQSAIPQ